MAQATQTRCTGCGWYIARREDAFDAEYDEYRSNEAAYVAEREEHSCDMDFYGANLDPKQGEFESYIAEVQAEAIAEAEAIVAAAAAQLDLTAIATEQEDNSGQPAAAQGSRYSGRRSQDRMVRGHHRPGQAHQGSRRVSPVASLGHPRRGRGEVLGLRRDHQGVRPRLETRPGRHGRPGVRWVFSLRSKGASAYRRASYTTEPGRRVTVAPAPDPSPDL